MSHEQEQWEWESDEIVWQDAKGNNYRMEDLSDHHLRNIIALLERTASAIDSMGFQGDMASFYADRDADKATDQAWGFRAELERRDAERFA